MYGWKARLGLVMPSPNTTVEMECRSMLPIGASSHSARLRFKDSGEPSTRAADIDAMNSDLETGVHSLLDLDPTAIGYACTTASFVHGRQYDVDLCDRMSDQAGVPFVTAASAATAALKELNADRIALITPYHEDVVNQQTTYLQTDGIRVVRRGGTPITHALAKGATPPEDIYRTALSIDMSDVDCVFLSCTNWPSASIIEQLEMNLQLPVISSNSALVWSLFKASAIREPVFGFGTLLRQHRAREITPRPHLFR